MTFSRSSRVYLQVSVAWFALGCSSSFSFAATIPASTPTAAPTPVFDRAQWQSRLGAFVNDARFSGALWGVKVASLDHSDLVFESHADRLMSPASNAKLYVGALALDRFGGDYCVSTPIVATAAPDAAGVVQGDLVVAGRGDPSWKARDAKRDFWATFEPFVAAVEHAGIHEITGALIADATYFAVAPAGDSWTVDDMNEDFGAEISAITLEDNYADVRVVPGEKAGDPCRVELVQPLTGIEIDNRTTTLAASSKASVQLLRLPGETIAHVSGGLPVGGKPDLVAVTIPRPAAWFAAALKAALERRGIPVRGVARSVRWPEPSPARGVAFHVGDVRSAPLRELVKGFMKPSQNLEADLIFLHVGESLRKTDTPAGLSANDLALAELHRFLKEHALRPDDVIFNEGSGLSRNDLTSAAATVSLLTFMQTHRERAAFVDSLPIAGVDGSLRRRFKGTPAENNLRAKTGSLRWANSLSGYLTTTSGEHVVFSLMLNRYSSPTGRESRQELDDLVALIAGYETRK